MDTICVSQHVVSQMCELLFSSPIPLLLLCPESNSKRSSVNVQCTACTDGRRAKQRWVRWAMFTFRALYGSFWYMWDDLMTDSVSAAACTEMIRNVQYSFFFRATGAPSHSVGEEQGIGEEDQDRGSLIFFQSPSRPSSVSNLAAQDQWRWPLQLHQHLGALSRRVAVCECVICTGCVDVGRSDWSCGSTSFYPWCQSYMSSSTSPF